MGQQPQLPPQEDLPCRLSFRSFTMIAATTAARIRLTAMVPAFSENHWSICIYTFLVSLVASWYFLKKSM